MKTLSKKSRTIRPHRGLALLCTAVGVLAACAAAAGVFLRGDGSTESVTSVRGEVYPMLTGGVYAFNAERVVAEGVGWDLVTLLMVVPALLLSVPAVARGSLRGRLFALGILAYLFYQYLMYAVYWALGPLFPLFVVLYALSAVAMVWTVSTIEMGSLPGLVSERFPRRGMAIFCVAMAVLLLGMWTKRIWVALSGDLVAAQLLGKTTLAVQALDLGMIVPIALATAVLIWRRRPWGYLLATVFAVKGVAMAGAICAMVLVAGVVQGRLQGAPLAIFATAMCVAGWLSYRMFGSIGKDEPAEGPRVAVKSP